MSDSLEAGEKVCRDLGRLIGDRMVPGWGFALVLFTFGDDGFATYISNADRDGMIKALRECADTIELGTQLKRGE